MTEIWINADPWDKELVTTALESGADGVIVSSEHVESVRELGMIKTVAEKIPQTPQNALRGRHVIISLERISIFGNSHMRRNHTGYVS